MSIHTSYDEKRDELREDMKECLKKAKELVVGEDIWGYDQMPNDYALKVYMAIKNAIQKI